MTSATRVFIVKRILLIVNCFLLKYLLKILLIYQFASRVDIILSIDCWTVFYDETTYLTVWLKTI